MTTVPSHEASPITPIRNVKNMIDANKPLFIGYPTPERFSICYGHTCQRTIDVGLSEDEWRTIRQEFKRPMPAMTTGSDSAQEREQIRRAIALLETVVGNKTGTTSDKGKNSAGFGLQGQMDCVDESTNTTVYLTMLQNNGLLKWHTVNYRTSRGVFSLQAPHFTAVIREKDNNQYFAVDSWFLDNGQPPFIVPLEKWESGWEPRL